MPVRYIPNALVLFNPFIDNGPGGYGYLNYVNYILHLVLICVKYVFMIIRQFWLEQLKNAWEKRPLVWLSGVRRSGKTTYAK
jgi:hypothetical protein